jgi:hypothetical protein
MLNYASKCLKITLKVIKFSKPEKHFPQKIISLQIDGGYPPPHVKFMLGINPPTPREP